MRVIRPDLPDVAMRIAEECLAANDSARLAELPNEARALGVTYTFVGFLARKPNGKGARVVDDAGNDLGPILRGDSLVTMGEDSN